MENIRCLGCGATLLGYVAGGISPFGHDSCPKCGESEFERLRDEPSD